jgi:hypothetical protein
MIIYNKNWLHNMRVVNLVESDLRAGRITLDEFVAIHTAHPVGFYLPGVLVRIGLFILTLIIAVFAAGLLSLLATNKHLLDSPAWPIFLGIACYAILEVIVKQRNYLSSGVDNALLYFSAILLSAGCVWYIMDLHLMLVDTLLTTVVLFVLFTYLTLRFADLVTAMSACVAFFAVVYFTWAQAAAFGNATMPFIMVVAAGSVYYYLSRIGQSPKTIYYAGSIACAKIVSLITIYAAGNYFVVNRLNNMLNGHDNSFTSVPFGIIFWLWTMLVPVVYLTIGIRNKNSIVLRLGMLTAVAAALTFRYYYHLLPAEMMFTLSGLFLLSAAYMIISYYKKRAVVLIETEDETSLNGLNLEGIIIGQTTNMPAATHGTASRFGGGTGGGGGSSSDF